MNSSIIIRRYPYEEPHHLNLRLSASNGRASGELDYYCNTSDLETFGAELLGFTGKGKLAYTLGSERPEDRFAHFLNIEVIAIDSRGHCAICIVMANNFAPPSKERSEFCIAADVADIKRLGSLMIGFSRLRHFTLDWRVQTGSLLEEDENGA
jgi:hypothetical protein